jgi:hypothetical protein
LPLGLAAGISLGVVWSVLYFLQVAFFGFSRNRFFFIIAVEKVLNSFSHIAKERIQWSHLLNFRPPDKKPDSACQSVKEFLALEPCFFFIG